MKRSLIWITFALAAGIVLCACSGSPSDGTGNSAVPSDAATAAVEPSATSTYEEVRAALTGDGGEWGNFLRQDGGMTFSYYRFYEDSTTGQLLCDYNSYAVSPAVEHRTGHDGTVVIAEEEIQFTFTRSGNEVMQPLPYTFEDGVLNLNMARGPLYKDDWEGIVDTIFTDGWTAAMLTEMQEKGYVLDLE